MANITWLLPDIPDTERLVHILASKTPMANKWDKSPAKRKRFILLKQSSSQRPAPKQTKKTSVEKPQQQNPSFWSVAMTCVLTYRPEPADFSYVANLLQTLC
eukprot:scpid88441/ scgid21064/ 